MTLATRLLVGVAALATLTMAAVVIAAGNRMHSRLFADTRRALEHEGRLVASQWEPAADPQRTADLAAAMVGHRVTLADSLGVVIGDSEYSGAPLVRVPPVGNRPEVVAARARGQGFAMHDGPRGRELWVATRGGPGFVLTSVPASRYLDIVRAAQRDLLGAGLLVVSGAMLLALLFARAVAKPVEDLRDVARDIAAGNLERRPSLTAPGEIGDLAAALHRMTEQLSLRLRALESEKELLQTVIRSLDEGLVVLSPPPRQEVVRLNERAAALLGLEQRQPPFPADFLPQEPEIRTAVRLAMSGAAPDVEEVQLGGRTLAVTARPLPDGGAVLAVLDLTTRRRLETIRRDFVANVSHELKTPLTVISGFAETLLDESLPADARSRFAATIHGNAMRMQHIVDDLLDLSRYESGSWVPERRPIALIPLIDDVFEEARTDADAKGLVLERDVRTTDPVIADPTGLRQIVGNLVENAVRYTNAGRIRVEAARADSHVEITVRDTGIGIPPDHLHRVFERFYRVDPSRSRAEGGTGLGLSIVRHLVEAHGGTVTAESEVGRGTAVTVRLPD